MSLTLASIISSFSIALILAAVFAALFGVERRRNLGTWAMAWFVYAFRFLFEILGMSYPNYGGFVVVHDFVILLSTDIAIFAAYRMVNRPARTARFIIGATVAVYLGVSIGTGFDSSTVAAALFLVTGTTYIWLGIVFLSKLTHSVLGKPIAGYGFIIWGLHKLDYPLLSPVIGAVPWAYFIASFLNLVVAIGILILFYENIRQDLLEREAKYHGVFNNTGDAILVYDSEGRMLETNRVACERLGYDPKEMVDMELRDILEPGAFERDGRRTMRLIKEQGHYAYESVYVARDGKRIQTEVNSSIVNYYGKEAILSVARDITERKTMENRLRQSLKEKEVLIREIHHRVKNNLQIIDSLLRLQSRYVVDPEDVALFRMSEDRVHTMALIHEQLYQSPNLSSIQMRSYLARLLGHLRSAYSTSDQGIVLEEDIADVLLDIEIASPCALIVNELVTNCLKHAFPAGRAGRIVVTLAAESKDDELLLQVADDGVGKVSAQSHEDPSTFGFLLVRNLADQMGARLSVTSRVSGTTVALSFSRTVQSK